jgi:hypothetical protein
MENYDTASQTDHRGNNIIRSIRFAFWVMAIDTQRRTEGWGCLGNSNTPKFRNFDKAETNFQFRGIYIHNNVIRIRVSYVCKSSGTPE